MDLSLIERLRVPTALYARHQVLARPSPIPRTAGLYAWYFRDLALDVPTAGCFGCSGFWLLYVGIAPKGPASQATLKSRIRQHMSGNASGSTLRLSLGCLLRQKLGIALAPAGPKGRLTFGRVGESVLNEWIADNARVTWIKHGSPWSIEREVIAAVSPPLNLDHNQEHPFYRNMRELRAGAARDARRSQGQ